MSKINQLPTIDKADVSFSYVFVLPNFIKNFAALESNPQLSFLASLEEYKKYYTDLEGGNETSAKYLTPYYVEGLGTLKPLPKRITKHSYWKTFRLTYERESDSVNDFPEYFFFLPLKIDFGTTKFKLDEMEYSADIYAYLFPYGAGCVNMHISLSNEKLNFDQFNELLERLTGKPTLYGVGTLKKFSEHVANKLNVNLFSNTEIKPIILDLHTLIVIRETNPRLVYFSEIPQQFMQGIGIASLLSNVGVDALANLSRDQIAEKLKGRSEKKWQKEEIQYFQDDRTLLYADPEWAKKKSKYSDPVECMCYNYMNFLSVIFSSNRFLKKVFDPLQNELPTQRRNDLVRYFRKVFIDNNRKVFYTHALKQIEKTIQFLEYVGCLK